MKKKPSDRAMMNFLERNPVIGLVVFGRLFRGKYNPVIGCKTARQAIRACMGNRSTQEEPK